MSNKLVINPTLTNKQKDAMRILLDYNNGISELVYGGAAGGGKSYLGCLFLIISCLKYKETRWLMGRSKLTSLKQSTLKTFFEVAKSLGLKENEHFTYNQQSNFIRFENGSEIILKDLFTYPSDPNFDSLGSIEIAGAFIDEANQVSEKAKNIVMSRIRHKLDEYNITPKMFMSCNPNKGWIYNDYYKADRDNKIQPHRAFIQAKVTDNNYISKHYISNLEKLDEISKKRLLYGEWEYSDSTSIIDYDAIVAMFNRQSISTDNQDYYLSVDVARLGKDKTCILIWKGYSIVEIIELEKQTLDIQLKKINELKSRFNIPNERIVIDTDGVGGGLADMLSGSINMVNNSKPYDGENYQNLKTQLYFKLGSLINDGTISIFDFNDDQEARLTQELQILKREKIDQDGKIRMTDKQQVKQQIGRSPDISDAMAYRMIFIYKSKVWDYEFVSISF
jgi:PBSX family phage terminase large subunit